MNLYNLRVNTQVLAGLLFNVGLLASCQMKDNMHSSTEEHQSSIIKPSSQSLEEDRQIFTASGAEVRSEFQVNTYTNSEQISPLVITGLSNGNFVVTWQSFKEGDSVICGQVFTASGSKVGSESQANTYTNSDQSLHQ